MKRCHSYNLDKESDYFFAQLKEHGNRITEQRKTLVRAIIKFQSPFSAEDLFGVLKKKNIDLATVYRSLTTFSDLGLLSTVDLSDGILRYEYISKEGHHHHHVVCTECKMIEPVNFCVVQGQEKIIEQMGYSDVSHKLEFFGLCKKCAG